VLGSLIIGIIQGSVIGLLAIGIVLVYKGSRVFNFAQAEFGSLAAYFVYFFVNVAKVPNLVAIVLALVVVAGVGWVMERLVVRPLFDAPRVTLLVASAGVALLAIGLELKFGGVRTLQVSKIVSGNLVTLFGAVITMQQALKLVVLAGLGAGLAYFFNKTDRGLAVLATSQESVATELVGIGTRKMSSFIWVFAAILGGIAGVLQAPDTTFFPGFMTTNFLLLGFTAAVVGGITSIAGAFLGGVIVGVVASLGGWLDLNFVHNRVPGIPDLAVFVVLITILLVRPKGLLGAEA
jgi:branched-chain amino acid transport system permease protein